MTAECLDERAFSDPWRAGDADSDGLAARVLLKFSENLLRHFLVGRGIAFNERDGAREDGPVSTEDTGRVIIN